MSSGRDSEIDEVVREFLSESRENLAQFESTLLEAERDPSSRPLLDALFRSVHSIKGSCGFLHFTNLEVLLHAGETLLARVRDGRIGLDGEVAGALLHLVDDTRRLLVCIETLGRDTDIDVTNTTALVERVAARATHGSSTSPIESPALAPLEALELDVLRATGAADGKIRVDVGLLDRLMNLVGELVLARNQIVQVSTTQTGGGAAAAPVQRLNLVTTELQQAVMKTRMQPIGNIWARFPRIVRDLAAATGKQVRLHMEGRETDLDKSIIEAIQDPLTHLVRNAVDHGIEPKPTRLAAGKAPEGRLALRAFHEGGMVNIEIADDGAGVDVERVRKRAVQLDLVAPERAARLSDAEAIELLFMPGFTTADNVTNLSGRGVGMDVVRTNIEKIGGTVDVQSETGQGTKIKIKIPLTLAIIPALIVGVSGERYAIPQASLLEVVRVDGDREIEMIQGAPVFRLRGKLLPVAYLGKLLEVETSSESDESVTIVVLQADDRTFGLVVDQIRDTEEIVVKPLWKQLKRLSCYAGATVMGDGKVALILDPMGLAERVGVVADTRKRALAPKEALRPEGEKATEGEELIVLCRLGGDGRLAIPLAHITRLEEFPTSRLERIGDRKVAQYRGEILPLVYASQVLEERRTRPRSASVSPESPTTSEAIQVVVFAREEKQVGLVVDGILDILGVRLELQQRMCRAGVIGTMVVQERVTEFLDVDLAIRVADPRASAVGGAT